MAAGIVLLPQPAAVHGREYGEPAPSPYLSTTQRGLVEAVRQGRGRSFNLFQWDGELGPQAETFRSAKLKLICGTCRAPLACGVYRRLIALRKGIRALDARGRRRGLPGRPPASAGCTAAPIPAGGGHLLPTGCRPIYVPSRRDGKEPAVPTHAGGTGQQRPERMESDGAATMQLTPYGKSGGKLLPGGDAHGTVCLHPWSFLPAAP
jgi:hypothetical protein